MKLCTNKADVYSSELRDISNYVENSKAYIRHKLALNNVTSYAESKKNIPIKTDPKIKNQLTSKMKIYKQTKDNEINRTNQINRNQIYNIQNANRSTV